MSIAAAILAGGRGERLGGVNKALIEIGGRRMIDYVLDACAGCEPVLLCGGRNVFAPDSSISADIIEDLPTTYGGPLAGVAAAVAALKRIGAPEFLLTTAVDTPFMPADFAARATGMLSNADVVVGSYEDQDYPTQALWRFEALSDLPNAVLAGTAPHSLKRLMAARRVQHIDYTAQTDNPFANANTPDELAALRARGPR